MLTVGLLRRREAWAVQLTMTLVLASCAAEQIDLQNTVERDGIVYAAEADEPFTGVVYSMDESGQCVAVEADYVNGVRHGEVVEYYGDGQTKRSETYLGGTSDGLLREWTLPGQLVLERAMKRGQPHGVSTTWYASGALESEATFSNGSLEGIRVSWYENGQKKQERGFKDGRGHGLTTEWYESGAVRSETMWRNGEPYGSYTRWHENGQNAAEGRYRDGQLVELRVWDEEGNEKPAPALPRYRPPAQPPPSIR